MNSDMVTAAITRVIVVDDHPLFRRGMVQLLNDSDDFNVVADFDNGSELLENVRQLSPQMLLLDLNMPQQSGIELLQLVRQAELPVRVVVITASEHSDDLFHALACGADGYLMKDTAPEDMLDRLRSALTGQVALNDDSVTLLAHALRHGQPPLADHPRQSLRAYDPEQNSAIHPNDDPDLTARERQTLSLISQGLNNKLIARELGISDGTVKVYVKSLLRKLNLHSRLELAAWVHQHPDSVNLVS
jgi:two-component system, NarL family, nitrate/nitrite response regulator NarL